MVAVGQCLPISTPFHGIGFQRLELASDIKQVDFLGYDVPPHAIVFPLLYATLSLVSFVLAIQALEPRGRSVLQLLHYLV